MKITYTPNPLATVVELDDHDKEVFKLKLRVEELEDRLGSAAIYLNPRNAGWVRNPTPRRPEGHTLETLVDEVLRTYLNEDYLYSEGSRAGKGLDARVDELFAHYVEELASHHVGDCTAFPMSCSKCHAEELLGINTLGTYPGKTVLHRIAVVFSTWNPETQQHDLPEVTLDEALATLQADPNGKDAYQYLLNYRNAHFPKD